ncbi:hypothetical protein [Alkalihalobacillus sp. 1P02AB]|uniref:hypothetical protein n=1 Tax=Alkalihalobacillus sp. 1P02AB TaxID=3132260 RepID=UPI0039A708D6
MSIFEFLLANPFVLIIIMGILFSFFKRQNPPNEEQQGQGQRQQRPAGQQRAPQRQAGRQQQSQTAGTEQTQRAEQREIKDWRDLFFEPEPVEEQRQEPGTPTKIERYPTLDGNVQNSNVAETEMNTRSNGRERLEETYDQLRRAQEEAARKFERQTQQQRKNKSSESLNLNFDNLSGKEAMRAVVMAEVIGPPRGRNPRGAYPRARR